jgi:hypothetical protein
LDFSLRLLQGRTLFVEIIVRQYVHTARKVQRLSASYPAELTERKVRAALTRMKSPTQLTQAVPGLVSFLDLASLRYIRCLFKSVLGSLWKHRPSDLSGQHLLLTVLPRVVRSLAGCPPTAKSLDLAKVLELKTFFTDVTDNYCL